MNDLNKPTAIIVADSHFHLTPDEAEKHRVAKFIELLELSRRADHLVLLGDIFDFWFDYPHFRMKGFDPILSALDQVREAGTRIHFIGGNHDVWAADFMHQRYGCSPRGETEILTIGDRRLLLIHGDGLLKFDWAYNSFRAVVRTKAGIVLAKSLHPEILFAFSTWLSGRSRSATRDEATRIETLGRQWLSRQHQPEWDLVVMGHVHHGFQTRAGNLEMASLPGWFDILGYGVLQDNRFSLLDFATDPPPEL
jgi:UDP-2,3-diacylglucosamine hydrolase